MAELLAKSKLLSLYQSINSFVKHTHVPGSVYARQLYSVTRMQQNLCCDSHVEEQSPVHKGGTIASAWQTQKR